MAYQTTSVEISGFVVGGLWWPTGAHAWKEVRFNATDWECRTIQGEGSATLREMCNAMLMEHGGDFQDAELGDCVLTITRTKPGGYRHSRHFPLGHFPSVSDMICSNWDGPLYDD
jgi:hypothetical protein